MTARRSPVEAAISGRSGYFTDGRAVRAAIARVGCPSMRDLRTGAVCVPRQDAADVIAALEHAGQRVDMVLVVAS